jgi:heparan-alpha-glucosaminide N-acetyltransferase
VSVDAYRGLVMCLMLAEALRSCAVSAALPASDLWRVACGQQTHAAWAGASLHDLIQPSFYFLVGVGLFFSITRRLSSGQPFAVIARHTAVRSAVLILLGMALVAVHPRQWVWWFNDTLTQIGLAYPFLFAIATRPKRDWVIAFGAILSAYWLLFAVWPLPPAGFDYATLGVSSEWLQAHGVSGFAAHWQKGTNAAGAFDRWFMNLFPRDAPYPGDPDGLATLNFIPSIATMLLGLMAAEFITRRQMRPATFGWLCLAGTLLSCAGLMLGTLGWCPVVKAIWTPSWVLFSGGFCLLFLATFYGLIELAGLAAVFIPLTVVGMNSIVAYCLSHVYPALAFNSIRRVFGRETFEILGGAYEPILYGSAVFAAYWLALYALYRLRIFVRI